MNYKGNIPELDSSEEITRILFVAARGVIYDWCLYDGKINLKDEMKKIISSMLVGFIGNKS